MLRFRWRRQGDNGDGNGDDNGDVDGYDNDDGDGVVNSDDNEDDGERSLFAKEEV